MPNAFFAPERISDTRHKTPEGYLVCLNVPIARTGCMEYLDGEVDGIEAGDDGVITAVRDESIFEPATLASFEGKPVTLDHPSGLSVDPDSWQRLAVGVAQNIRRGSGVESDLIIADLLVTDGRAIERIESGDLREVSCGYSAAFEQISKGKARQVGIVGNHVAIVSEGRAGARCSIKDSKGVSVDFKTQFKEWLGKMTKVADEMPEAEKPETKPESEEKVADEVDPIAALVERITALEDVVAKLVQMEQQEAADEEPDDTADKCGDEEPDGKKDDGVVVGDSASVTRAAKIIAPDLHSHRAVVADMRRALYAARLTKVGGEAVRAIIGDTAIERMGANSLAIAVRAVGAQVAAHNDRTTRAAALAQMTADRSPSQSVGDIAGRINELNTKFWSDRK